MSDSESGEENLNKSCNRGKRFKRRVFMRVKFDDSDVTNHSDSSHDDQEKPGTSTMENKKSKKFVLCDDSDSSVEENGAEKAETNSKPPDGNVSNSDSSDGSLEKCPICLLSFREQEVGIPDICDHVFCAVCIEEWSKNVSTCPIDRKPFKIIIVRKDFEACSVTRRVQVACSGQTIEVENEADLTHCEVCNQSNREDVMLLCDGCNLGYHTDCLEPPLSAIPDGFWYCDNCFASEGESIIEDINLLYEDLREMGIPETRLRIREYAQRMIPRTRQSERIRATILARTRGREENGRAAIQNVASTSGGVRRATAPRKKRTKKRRGRKKRSFVVEYDVNNFDEKFQLRTVKRYVRRRKSRKIKKARSVRSTGRSCINRGRKESDGMSAVNRAERSVVDRTSFSLFGNANSLEYFSDESEDETINRFTVEAGRSGETSVETYLRSRNVGPSRRRKGALLNLGNTTVSQQPDLLSGILELQGRWLDTTRGDGLRSVKIDSNGILNFAENNAGNKKDFKPIKAFDEAPLYPGSSNQNYTPRGGQGGGGYNNNRYSNQQNNRNSISGSSSFGNQNFGGNQRYQDRRNNSYGNSTENTFFNDFPPTLRNRFQNNRNDRRNNRFSINIPMNNGQNGNRQNTNPSSMNFSPAITPQNPEVAPVVSSQINYSNEPNRQQNTESEVQVGNFGFNEIPLPNLELTSRNDFYSSEPEVLVIPPLAPPPWNQNLFKLAGEPVDDDKDEDCPNFSVYSAESFQVARQADNVADITEKENTAQEDAFQEKEEDLVQLGDEDDIPDAITFGNVSESEKYEPDHPTGIDQDGESNETSNKTPLIENSPEKEPLSDNDSQASPEAESEVNMVTDVPLPSGKSEIELHDDSDWEEFNTDKKNNDNDQVNNSFENVIAPASDSELEFDNEIEPKNDYDSFSKSTDGDKEKINDFDRSYTPCLDEKTEHEDLVSDSGTAHTPEISQEIIDTRMDISAGICGLETELISEDDEETVEKDNVGSSKNEKTESTSKRSKKGQFKKISKNTKERNYRDKVDKDRGRSRRRSRERSRSNDKENREDRKIDQRRQKRKDMVRYDVRNVIGQPRAFKDRYGRDTSRPPVSGSRSKSRSRRSVSRSPSRKSFSISPSPVSNSGNRKVASKRKSVSPRRNRTPRRSRSRSIKRRLPVKRRSRSSIRRRSRSPIRTRVRSPIVRRRTRSPLRNRTRSPVHNLSRSPIRKRSLSAPRHKTRSPSPPVMKHISRRDSRQPRKLPKSPARPFSPKRSRSRTLSRSMHQPKRSRERKKKRGKKRLTSISPPVAKLMSATPERSRKRKRQHSLSNSPEKMFWSPRPNEIEKLPSVDESWTPPLVSPNANLTVILKNKEALAKKKRDKKKRSEKRGKELKSKVKDKRKRRSSENRESPPAPSKEVFASGDNILVSVSFNKDNNVPPQQTTVVTLPPTREEIVSNRRSPDRRKQKKVREKLQRKHKKIDTKPVAIIDLDRSPFQIMESPREVIVLTDDSDPEVDKNDTVNQRKASDEVITRDSQDRIHDGVEKIGARDENSHPKESFELQQLGPKTPPEPPVVKFSLSAKSIQVKTRNPLHDEDEDLEHDLNEHDETEHEPSEILGNNKIGPNTPPESGPCSPDAYDPFDPTKSPSMSPSSPEGQTAETVPDIKIQSSETGQSLPSNVTAEKSLNPVELVMALMSSKTAIMAKEPGSNDTTFSIPNSIEICEQQEKSEEQALPKAPVSVISNVLITPSKSQQRSVSAQLASPASKSCHSIVASAGGKTLVSKLPFPKNASGGNVEIESPYSPGSDDYDDLFEPPANDQGSNRPRGIQKSNKPSNKAQMFDNLFGSGSPPGIQLPNSAAMKRKGARHHKKTSVRVSKLIPGGTSKMDEDQIKIFDDLPSSAVELQVKDKFLRKLNRQERVVEEVKLVLKPHYNKKHITKDDYKEILRRSVPKICHSRSDEINTKKIQNLIEAYVKKFRHRNKLGILNTGQVSSASKCAAYLKKL